jgi:F0F1-type ATP synthase membrane subunit c/vacuolar-type H+-ATPase subunit K
LSFGLAVGPLGGCAGAVGLIFSSLLESEAYSPELDESLFSHAMLGFALVETFAVVVFMIIALIAIF